MPEANKSSVSVEERDRLRAAMLERQKLNRDKRIDNGSLPAGSPMHYYCRICFAATITLDESDFSTKIPECCKDCDELVAKGCLNKAAP